MMARVPTRSNADRLEIDPAGVGDFYISLHSSLTCWERNNKDVWDPETFGGAASKLQSKVAGEERQMATGLCLGARARLGG